MISRLVVRLLVLGVVGYQQLLRALFHGHGGGCRFHPTCSEYAREALERHGPLRGLWLSVLRLGGCHPFGESGVDPVPVPRPARPMSWLTSCLPENPTARRSAKDVR